MIRKVAVLITALMGSLTLSAFAAPKPTTIGIVIPISLPAMTQIVNGYETRLKELHKGPLQFTVKNAQGDINIQRAILQEFKQNNVDIIAPVGTDAAQMAIHMIRNKPIIGIAAELGNKKLPANATNVLDEVSVAKQIAFIHKALPNIKKITLIYSASGDRIFTEVKKAVTAGKKNNIQVQKLMIEQLPELYTVRQHIAPNSQAVFILKDEMVVSGIRALVQQAEQRHIPVIASDDGSVGKGAAFAVGVSETDIGHDAAELTNKVLNGMSAGKIPQKYMTKYKLFINSAAAKKQNLNLKPIIATANGCGYKVVQE